MKAFGQIAGAASVMALIVTGGLAIVAVGNAIGLATTPLAVKAISALADNYFRLDSNQRRAVNVVAGVLWGRIEVIGS